MTLKEFIIKKKNEAKFWTKSDDLNLDSSQLETMLEELKTCKEFENTNIIIVDAPRAIMEDKNGEKSIPVKTVFLHEGTKFGKEIYLYAINVEHNRIKIRGHFEYYSVPNESTPIEI